MLDQGFPDHPYPMTEDEYAIYGIDDSDGTPGEVDGDETTPVPNVDMRALVEGGLR